MAPKTNGLAGKQRRFAFQDAAGGVSNPAFDTALQNSKANIISKPVDQMCGSHFGPQKVRQTLSGRLDAPSYLLVG